MIDGDLRGDESQPRRELRLALPFAPHADLPHVVLDEVEVEVAQDVLDHVTGQQGLPSTDDDLVDLVAKHGRVAAQELAPRTLVMQQHELAQPALIERAVVQLGRRLRGLRGLLDTGLRCVCGLVHLVAVPFS